MAFFREKGMRVNQYKPSSCLACGDCAFCPEGIELERVIVLTDRALRGENVREDYEALKVPAGKCIGCGRCLRHCKHGVNIMDRMSAARKTFGF